MIRILRIAVFSLLGVLVATQVDYCNPKMCPKQGRHIRCGNNGGFSSNCTGDYALVPMEPHLIELILKEHNTYRSILASGDLKCFNPACRMPFMVWDNELAAMAAYNVRTCYFEHDHCRSTPKYRYSGQNIYYTETVRLKLRTEEFIEEAIFLWFDEYKDADYTVMESYHVTEPQTGHFTTLMNDRQDRVGCAYLNVLLPGGKKRMVIFTCNYPSTNMQRMPSYKACQPPNAECRKPNALYPALCDDPIDPEDFKRYK